MAGCGSSGRHSSSAAWAGSVDTAGGGATLHGAAPSLCSAGEGSSPAAVAGCGSGGEHSSSAWAGSVGTAGGKATLHGAAPSRCIAREGIGPAAVAGCGSGGGSAAWADSVGNAGGEVTLDIACASSSGSSIGGPQYDGSASASVASLW